MVFHKQAAGSCVVTRVVLARLTSCTRSLENHFFGICSNKTRATCRFWVIGPKTEVKNANFVIASSHKVQRPPACQLWAKALEQGLKDLPTISGSVENIFRRTEAGPLGSLGSFLGTPAETRAGFRGQFCARPRKRCNHPSAL